MVEIKITPQPKQKLALQKLSNNSPASVVGYGGARGGGKSRLARDWQLLRRSKYPRTSGVIIRKTYPELLNNHVEELFRERPGLYSYYNKAEKVLRFPNGSLLYFRHLQHPDDVYTYQGQAFEDIVLDEATQHTEEVFKILRTSNRTTSNTGIRPKFLSTFNPGGIGHMWVKRIYIDKNFLPNENPDDYDFVQANVYDNQILLNADPGYIKNLESLDENKRKAWLYGDWDVFEGQFFNEWRADKHIIEPRYELKDAPDSYKYVLSWDDGTLKPRSVHIEVQDNDGRVEIVWEYYGTGETASEAARKIRADLERLGIMDKLIKRGRFIYDPSMDIRNNQTGKPTSLVVSSILGMHSEKANNDRIEGARRFKEYMRWDELNEPLLRVWNTCPHFIRTVPALIYDERGIEDIDTDGEDHAYDDVRYGLMSLTNLPNRLKGSRNVIKKKQEKPKSMLKVPKRF